MKVLILIALITVGPLVFVLGTLGVVEVLRWGSNCKSDGRALECDELFGLFAVNPDSLSYVGAGYGIAFTAFWAAASLGILAVGATIFVIGRFFW